MLRLMTQRRRVLFPFASVALAPAVAGPAAFGATARLPQRTQPSDHMAFLSPRSGSWDLYTMDPDTLATQRVTSGVEREPAISPDGNMLAY